MSKPRPTRRKDKCSSRIWMVAEDEVDAEEVNSTYPTKGTQTFGKKTESIEEPSEEGGLPCRTRSAKMPPTYNYCGKIGHHEEECRKRRSESASTSRQLTNYVVNAEYVDYSGLFVMRHRENSMMASNSSNFASTSNSEHAWFLNSGASHHMTSHK